MPLPLPEYKEGNVGANPSLYSGRGRGGYLKTNCVKPLCPLWLKKNYPE